jgi:hypothetical protein
MTSDLDEFVENAILGAESRHFDDKNVDLVRKKLSEKLNVTIRKEEVYVVGSAKLGYGLFEKKTRDGNVLPAFRAFGPDSDIDIAITSLSIFREMWNELSVYSNNQAVFPWNSGRLGDYLIFGWLRMDLYPRNVRLPKRDAVWDTFASLSSDYRLGRKAIRGAFYYSRDQLKLYQLRGLHQCRRKLESQI